MEGLAQVLEAVDSLTRQGILPTAFIIGSIAFFFALIGKIPTGNGHTISPIPRFFLGLFGFIFVLTGLGGSLLGIFAVTTTATPTTPPTPPVQLSTNVSKTISLSVTPFDSLNDVRVVLEDNFDSLDSSFWGVRGNVTVENGVLKVTDVSTAAAPSLGEGNAVRVTFRYNPNSYFALYVWDPSKGGPPAQGVRHFSLQRRRGEGTFWRFIQDTITNDTPFRGMLPDTWFVLALKIGEDDKIEGYIQERDTAKMVAGFTQQMSGDWQKRFWNFVVEGVEGTIEIDEYQELLVQS